MNEDERIKQAISALLDGEASADEQRLATNAIRENAEYARYYEELKKLSLSLKQMPDELPSPDLEQKLTKVKEREGLVMKVLNEIKHPRAAVGVLVVAVAFVLVKYVQQPADVSVGGGLLHPPVAVVDDGMKDLVSEKKPVAFVEKDEASDVMLAEPAAAPARTLVESAVVAQAPASVAKMKARAPKLAAAPAAMRSRAHGMLSADQAMVVERDRVLLPGPMPIVEGDVFDTEDYGRLVENPFLDTIGNPLSTFSIDVDTGAYSIVRRFLNEDRMPSKDAVRIEEMINYFTYDYPQPEGGEPFSISTEVGNAPWSDTNQLVKIGLQGKSLDTENLPPSNLVFLIDVSGSMNQANKLPLLKKAFRNLIAQLSAKERVAIVTYAGNAGLVLESTTGDQKETILQKIDSLTPSGSTAGAAGIKLAYEIAQKNFIQDGNNRVILASDGDFNVGVSSQGDLERLVEEKRESGVFLTVLGFGTGNYKDARIEQIANKGNGTYHYIDNLMEAKKVLVTELGSTLFTIAKDVKLQIEFNPSAVKSYRLLGYENRMMRKEDFNDDTKDAGEMGAGHTVTALYEIVPADSTDDLSGGDSLKYQEIKVRNSDDLLTVKLRYKEPDGDTSKLITHVLGEGDYDQTLLSDDFHFAIAVAEFGLLLRESEFKGQASYDHVLATAKKYQGGDPHGYRAEFIKLVEKAKLLAPAGGSGIQFKGKSA